jgi:hypothetical protein
MNQKTLLGVIVAIGISLILATRNIYIAIDDENYINYFSSTDYGFSDLFSLKIDNWWNFLLDEPLWRRYSAIMGQILNAESALKVTIFFSSSQVGL